MTVERILDKKGHQVFSCSEQARLKQAILQLADHHIGVLVAVDAAGEPVGILSERDVVKAIADGMNPESALVSEAMTRVLVSCSLDDSDSKVMDRMTKANVRHLPVKHFGKLVGVVSARDILRLRMEKLEDLLKEIRIQAEV